MLTRSTRYDSTYLYTLQLMEQIQVNNGSSKTMEDRLRAKISELEVKVHEARDELEQANRTASKSSVMHLEIADFERTVSNLQSEVKEKEESVSNLQQRVGAPEE
ncbi:hypothetical protein EB796_015473 [Bugula neritina]|uniref:Uncharacterized protein n=1 Tax=Bugula neritina TaxID=10212 RepID=A0A7J7JLH9_BUGNE|nr:hypothetical protein EB796_015473 [Bugula neritina]